MWEKNSRTPEWDIGEALAIGITIAFAMDSRIYLVDESHHDTLSFAEYLLGYDFAWGGAKGLTGSKPSCD